jgi:hypothetical protein
MKIPINTDPMVAESIKDEEQSRKISITTIVFMVFVIGITLMILAYMYGYLTTGT